MKPKVLKTETDYESALAALDALLDAPSGSAEADELELWSHLVEEYEAQHHAIPLPDPISAIRFRMDQQRLKQADLVPYIGSKSKVSEVLSGRRPLSLAMIRRLHSGLGIPLAALVAEPGTRLSTEFDKVDWAAFPLAEMVKRGWFAGVVETWRELLDRAEEVLGPFLQLAGPTNLQMALARQRLRSGQDADPQALWAWRARVAQLARDRAVDQPLDDELDVGFIAEVARLSVFEDGPRLAVELLAKHGIVVAFERHLPRTHLDGAALQIDGLPPIVALTLRHDRIDAFWFTLCHELAHVLLHFGAEGRPSFVDDLEAADTGELEAEADRVATQALIRDEEWAALATQASPTAADVAKAARRLRVHPAIIAGRYRKETGNYKLLSALVGEGRVRRLFEPS